MITPTNQAKHSVSPIGEQKYGVYLWGDSISTWGDPIATWGGNPITPTNQTKKLSPALWASTTFPWQETAPWSLTGGPMTVTNQSKS